MHEFEIAIRLIVIGQELLMALIFLFGSGSKGARVSGALLLTGAASYLLTSDPVLSESVPILFPLVTLFSVALPFFVWAFSKTLFDYPTPNVLILILFAAFGLAVWVIFMIQDRVSESLFTWTFTASRFVSMFIVASALWMSASGRPDDLLEQRRRFRSVFVVLISLLVIAILIVEVVLGQSATPGWLSMLSVILIGGLTIGLAIPMLKLREDLFPPSSEWCCTEPGIEQAQLSAADRVLHEKLMAGMNAGSYRQTGLTIRSLAEELSYPEHHLRRLINSHLGFRNFSAFLNSYRIEEAKERLANPEFARTPVLTIALDLGYGSLGPFNRAFKAMTAMTPTQFREQEIPADSD